MKDRHNMAISHQIVKDTKYSWLVMVAALLSNFLCGMLTYGSVSVLSYVWADTFKLDADIAAWAPSIMGACFQLTGPIVVIIIHLIGPWKTQMLAAIMILGSSVATAFATQYWHVIVSYAIVQGTGASVIYLTGTEVVGLYFEKHRDKMYPAQALSFAVSMIAIPSLLEYMIKILSYKTAMIILAMPHLLAFPIALVYRGPCHKLGKNNDHPLSGNDNVRGEESPVEDKFEMSNTLQTEGECGKVSLSALVNNNLTVITPAEADREVNPSKLKGNSENDIIACEETTPTGTTETKTSKRSVIKSHLYVLKDWKFVLFLFYFLVTSVGESTFYAFAVDYSVTLEILDLKQAALGMTLSGVSLCAACLVMAILSHWQLNRLAITIGSAFVMGISLTFISLCRSLPTIYACFIIYGFTEGVYIANAPTLVQTSFKDSDYMLIRLSYVYVMTGIGSLVGPVMTGHFAESFGIQYLYYFLGVFPLTGSAVLLPYFVYQKVASCRKLSNIS